MLRLISVFRLAMARRGSDMKIKHQLMTWVLTLAAALSMSCANAQREVVYGDIVDVHDSMPEGGFMVFGENYITMNGLYEYDPISHYNYDKEFWPEIFSTLVNDSPGAINFTMESNFWGVDGSSYVDEDTVLVSSGRVNKRMLTGGRYKDFKWTYWQPNPNKGPDQPERLSGWRTIDTKVIFPVIRKIPFYLATDLLGGVTFKTENIRHRFIEPTLYDAYLGRQASLVAMDLVTRMTEEDHFSCPILYEFKFMGYVDGFSRGISTSEHMSRLPDGLTFVPSIDVCDGVTKPDKITAGCATVGGTKAAVRIDLVRQRISGDNRKLGAVMLHELLHTQGDGHNLVDPENLMTDASILAAPYLDQKQCEMLIKRKSYIMGFSGFEPWE